MEFYCSTRFIHTVLFLWYSLIWIILKKRWCYLIVWFDSAKKLEIQAYHGYQLVETVRVDQNSDVNLICRLMAGFINWMRKLTQSLVSQMNSKASYSNVIQLNLKTYSYIMLSVIRLVAFIDNSFLARKTNETFDSL